MSQPEVFGPQKRDPHEALLTNMDQLVELFHQSARSRDDFMVGIEYEMFAQIEEAKRPLPYEGPLSISSFFSHLLYASREKSDPFVAIREGDNLVGLSCKRAVIALEPGGQIEIAARPHKSLLAACDAFTHLVSELKDAAVLLGIDLFALGVHPNARREDMAAVKKARYGIMRRTMNDLNGLGLDMMTRSCAIQINLDYENEKDLVNKARLGAALVPFYSLFCTSSAFIDGKPAIHAIERGNVWRKTDPRRTGIPAFIFSPNFGYAAWINFVLDVPMYFIRRGQTYHDARDASFREFMRDGMLGFQATVRDFIDHMSTVFTEIRLKPILELRSPDSLPVPFVNALTALSWALFYEKGAHQNITNFFADVGHHEIVALHNEAIDNGKRAQFRGRPIFEAAEHILGIAERALLENNLAYLLTPLKNLVARNITCTEWILANFQPLNHDNFRRLIKEFDPLNNPVR